MITKSGPLTAAAVLVVVLLASFPMTAPGIFWGDHPELATAAAVLGVAHGPGYPTYSLLSHLTTLILPLSAARAANLFSWLCAGFAAALAVLLALRMLKRLGLNHAMCIFSAAVLGLAFAANLDQLSQSLVSEVYALNSLLIWLMLLATCLYMDSKDARWAYLWALVTGLAAGNHLQSGLLAQGLLIVILSLRKASHLRIALLGLAFMLGLGVYLFMPLRSAAHAPLDWGVTQRAENFIWSVTNQGFMEGKFTFPLEQVLRACGMLGELLWDRMGPIALTFAALGLALGWRIGQWRALWLATLISLILSAVFLVNNLAPMFEWTVFAIPSVVLVLMLAIWGLAIVIKFTEGLKSKFVLIIACLIISLLAVWPIARFLSVLDLFDRAGSTAATEVTASMLGSLPPAAVVINNSSAEYFATEHLQVVEGQRPDVAQAFGMLLSFDWAREQFHQRAPGFVTPSRFGYHVILNYCLMPQSTRTLFYQPSEPLIDRYLAIHLVPWGMLYRMQPYISFHIAEYLSDHERLLAEADDILGDQKDFFSASVGQINAEARTAYYFYLANAAALALSYQTAQGAQIARLESQLKAQDPPLSLEISRRLPSDADIAAWEMLLQKLGAKEKMRAEHYRAIIVGKVN